MGAEQSSSVRQETGGSAEGAVRKTCYYEVLGIERQASEDECVICLPDGRSGCDPENPKLT